MWAIGGQLVDLVSHFLERNSRSKVHTNVLKQRTYKCVKKPAIKFSQILRNAKCFLFKIGIQLMKCKALTVQRSL